MDVLSNKLTNNSRGGNVGHRVIISNHRLYSRFISKKYFKILQKKRKTSEMRLQKTNKHFVLLVYQRKFLNNSTFQKIKSVFMKHLEARFLSIAIRKNKGKDIHTICCLLALFLLGF